MLGTSKRPNVEAALRPALCLLKGPAAICQPERENALEATLESTRGDLLDVTTSPLLQQSSRRPSRKKKTTTKEQTLPPPSCSGSRYETLLHAIHMAASGGNTHTRDPTLETRGVSSFHSRTQFGHSCKMFFRALHTNSFIFAWRLLKDST